MTELQKLQEIFHDRSVSELQSVLTRHGGSADAAADAIMQGQVPEQRNAHVTCRVSGQHTNSREAFLERKLAIASRKPREESESERGEEAEKVSKGNTGDRLGAPEVIPLEERLPDVPNVHDEELSKMESRSSEVHGDNTVRIQGSACLGTVSGDQGNKDFDTEPPEVPAPSTTMLGAHVLGVGAHAVSGMDASTTDAATAATATTHPSSSQGIDPSDMGQLHFVSARLVHDEEQGGGENCDFEQVVPPLAIATRPKAVSIDMKNRCVQIGLAILCIVIVGGAAIVANLVINAEESQVTTAPKMAPSPPPSPRPTSNPTSPPTQSPTSKYFQLKKVNQDSYCMQVKGAITEDFTRLEMHECNGRPEQNFYFEAKENGLLQLRTELSDRVCVEMDPNPDWVVFVHSACLDEWEVDGFFIKNIGDNMCLAIEADTSTYCSSNCLANGEPVIRGSCVDDPHSYFKMVR